ncbi:MAG: TetR/AcrR family transcriptional regulator, partial [Lachnospiraceae bacterium]|nr:TetR/AcrR family transcriptional regulator [Lachnospiraceae bacterium]
MKGMIVLREEFTLLPPFDESMDRRQKKTRYAIETALIELIEEKPLENLTISEVADRADINRKTFYNNYDSIEDVLHQLNNRISLSISKKLPSQITINNEIEIYNLFLDYMT